MTPSDAARGAAMIRTRGLAKTYRTRRRTVEAVRGVSFDVSAGEIVGFLGPNGAGKTTTLQMLTTLAEPTAGEATVAGHDLRADPVGVRRSIGYVAQGGSAGSDARVGEELEFQARFYGLPDDVARERTALLLGQLELGDLGSREVKTLSGGQRRRLDIALGLVHGPSLVFLDEPTTGLDPQSRSNMWGHIAGLRNDFGTTVFITTHYLEEADALCDRILVIDDGRIVAEGTPDALKSQVSGDLVSVTVAGDPRAAIVIAGRCAAGAPVEATDHTVSFRVPQGERVVVDLLRQLDAAGIELDGLAVQRPTLDDVFLTLTGRSLRDDSTPNHTKDEAA